MKKRILVTGIGGIVGQGVLKNIQRLGMDFELIGTNVTPVSSGNYLCDNVYVVPYAYEKNYIAEIDRIVKNHSVDLIIPSTDYETYHLGLNSDKLSCVIACAPYEVVFFCLDKYVNYQAFKKFNIPFAESSLPSLYQNQFSSIVVKPREGRGSRNVFINPEDPNKFDDTYLIQEYLEGPELTTAFYITKSGALHGLITLVRDLDFGSTVKCEVVFDYDNQLKELILKMLVHYNFRGSCNIQSRVTNRGVIPFEINCRISGTNSIRSHFGFRDVQYTIEEYLLNRKPTPCSIVKGSALRVMVDIIYPRQSLSEIKNSNDDFFIS